MSAMIEQIKQGIHRRDLSQYGIYFAFIILCVFFAVSNPVFLSMGNIINILRQISFNAILAMGMTVVIITGGIDLSVGSVLAVAAVVSTSFIKEGNPQIPVAAAILSVCYKRRASPIYCNNGYDDNCTWSGSAVYKRQTCIWFAGEIYLYRFWLSFWDSSSNISAVVGGTDDLFHFKRDKNGTMDLCSRW